MAQPSAEWEEPLLHLPKLAHVLESKGAKAGSEDSGDAAAQLDAVEPLNAKDGSRRQAIDPKQVDEVGRGQVSVDVLHTQKACEGKSAAQQAGLLSCQDKRCNEETVHASIVLEMDMINDKESWGEQDGNGSSLGGSFGCAMRRVDEAGPGR